MLHGEHWVAVTKILQLSRLMQWVKRVQHIIRAAAKTTVILSACFLFQLALV